VKTYAYSPACKSTVDRTVFNTDLRPGEDDVDADDYYRGMAGRPVRPGILTRKPRAQTLGARLAHGHDMEEIVFPVDHPHKKEMAKTEQLLRRQFDGRMGRPPWNPEKGGSGVCFHAFYTTPGKKDFKLYETPLHDADANFTRGKRISNTFPDRLTKQSHHTSQLHKATFDNVVYGRDLDKSGDKNHDAEVMEYYRDHAGLDSETMGRHQLIMTAGRCPDLAVRHTERFAADAAASSSVLLDATLPES